MWGSFDSFFFNFYFLLLWKFITQIFLIVQKQIQGLKTCQLHAQRNGSKNKRFYLNAGNFQRTAVS